MHEDGGGVVGDVVGLVVGSAVGSVVGSAVGSVVGSGVGASPTVTVPLLVVTVTWVALGSDART